MLLSTYASSVISKTEEEHFLNYQEVKDDYLKAKKLLDDWERNSENLETAYNLLSNILQENKNFVPAYIQMARVIMFAGYKSGSEHTSQSINNAEQIINMALELDPEYADAYVKMGWIKSRPRFRKPLRFDEVYIALDKATKLGSKDPWINNYYGEVFELTNAYQESIYSYYKVLHGKKHDFDATKYAHTGLISVYTKTNELEKAREHYLQTFLLGKPLAWDYGNYANFLLFHYGDLDESIVNSRKALELKDYGLGRYYLAAALYTKGAKSKSEGKIEDANKYFKEAVELYPNKQKMLSNAAGYNSTYIIAKEFKDDGVKISENEELGFSALHMAAKFEQLKAINGLISYGADVNFVDSQSGMTPLIYAIEGGKIEAVKLLVDNGADIDTIKTNGGWTAMDFAKYYKHPQILEYLNLALANR